MEMITKNVRNWFRYLAATEKAKESWCSATINILISMENRHKNS